MSKVAMGHEVLNMLAEALDLPLETTRVVIDLPADGPARVIRVDLLTQEQAAAVVASLKQVNPEVI